MTDGGKRPHRNPFVVVSLILAVCLSVFTSICGFGILIFDGCVGDQTLFCWADGVFSILAFPLCILIFVSRRILAWLMCVTAIVVYCGAYAHNWQRGWCYLCTHSHPFRIAYATFLDYRVLVSWLTAGMVLYAYQSERHEIQRLRRRS
jgi:hypothetical protein